MDMPHNLPPITLATSDYNRLLFTAMVRNKPGRGRTNFLLSELRRAEICHPAALPEDVVSTNCRVMYRIDGEPKMRTHLLVHPDDLIWPGAEISVATPLGTALLGLRVGDRMPFLDEEGMDHEVFVEGIGLRFLDDTPTITRSQGTARW